MPSTRLSARSCRTIWRRLAPKARRIPISLARVAPDYRRILVVDDDPNVVELVRQLLEGERCAIDWAPDGAAGLDRIA